MANEEQVSLLKQGVNIWDKWRQEDPAKEIDLNGADLSNAILDGANLYEANLYQADLSNANLSNANLGNANLGNANLYEANINGANLSNANLYGAKLFQAKLFLANLRGANLSNTYLSGARLYQANLDGANLYQANINGANLRGANFSNANLEGVNLDGTNLSKVNLSNAKLDDANLYQANLSNANLSNANLYEAKLYQANLYLANLRGANLSNTYLSDARLYQANLDGANLYQANINSANFDSASLRNANLRNANLRNADLYYASLSNANLSNANLDSSNLSFADLRDIYLYYADLRGVDLYYADLRGADLTLIQAIGAKFIHSDLTGACIADWHINSATNFEGVKCDYIYRRFDKEHDQFTDRLPVSSDRVFQVGEFEEWIRISSEAQQTIDLIFTDGIDWQSFFQSLQGVLQEYPNANVGLQAIEEKGTAFVIRLRTSSDADQSAIELTQKELYSAQLQLREAQGELKVLRRMPDVLMQLAGRPSTSIEYTFNDQVGNVATKNEGDMQAIQHGFAKNAVKLNPWMTFLSWFQNGQAIIAITALTIGVASTYFIPKIFPDGFPPVNPDTQPESIQGSPSSPQTESGAEEDGSAGTSIPTR